MNYHLIYVETKEEERIEIKDGGFICYSNFPLEDFDSLKENAEEGKEFVKCNSS